MLFLLYTMELRNGLNKAEKLKSRKDTDALFATRQTFAVAKVRVFYSIKPSQDIVEIKAGFGCGKKYFRHAVRRNRAKRLMREAYRTQKHSLWDAAQNNNKSLHIFFLFSRSELISYIEMQSAFVVILQKLEGLLSKSN